MQNDVSCSYTYDGEQRMASATCGGVTTYYVYDGEGQRVAKLNASGAVTEQDVYNTAGQVLMRYNGSGGWLEGEVWAGSNHLAIYANGQTYFPLTDQVGTERARFSYTGGIVQTCMSQPFGDNLQCTGTDSSPYKFGKLERDLESGDDHAQQRDYNSNPYRWFTPDPGGVKVVKLEDRQTWNMYAYAKNNPTTNVDPTGLDDYYVFLPLASDVSGSWAVIQAEAPNYGNTVTIYAGAAATSANYQSAIQTPDANVVFAGHTTDFVPLDNRAAQAGGVLLGDNQGVGRTDTTINGQPLAATGDVKAASVSIFGCNSTDLAGQYSGTTFTGTKPTTNTTAENAGAAAFTDAMVRGKDTTQAGQAAEAAMVKKTNEVNKLPENQAHPYPKPSVCTTVNNQTTCHQ
jgi:RHS repeat-associated protein